MQDAQRFLNESELFARLKQESKLAVVGKLRRSTFEADATICEEGDRADAMYLIVAGEVAALQKMGWGYRLLRKLGPGDAVGEMALLGDDSRTATLKCITRTECLSLDKDIFRWLLDSDPTFAQSAALVLSKRLSSLGRSTSDDLLKAYHALICSMAVLADSRDKETGAHIARTRNYCSLLAERLRSVDGYGEAIDAAFVESIYQVSPLHDIGKVAIPDSILQKPGKLDASEFEAIKKHPSAGSRAIEAVLEECDLDIFKMARHICLHHHERWDGAGYPKGLVGADIPIEARIMAIADVYDALLSPRVYKPAFSPSESAAQIEHGSGTQFDPVMVRVFIDHLAEFESIYENQRGDV